MAVLGVIALVALWMNQRPKTTDLSPILKETQAMLEPNTRMLNENTKALSHCLEEREKDQALTRAALAEVQRWKDLCQEYAQWEVLTNRFQAFPEKTP